MKKKNFFIAVFIISIIGLAIVQYKYLEIGLNLAKVQFGKKIGSASESIKNDLSLKDQLTFLVGKALKRDDSYFKLSLENVQDASSHFLNDFLTEKLVHSGIETDFSYELFAKDTTYYLASPVVFKKDDNVVAYPIELKGYLPELMGKRLILELKFKDLNNYFLFQLNGLTLPSLLFIIGILAAIVWALSSYYWQRNLITTTNEFINNLTHELKTPVFSIGLATKILEQKVDKEQKPVIAILRQQVDRLTDHIDKVLELGSLESGKRIFKLEKVDFRPFLEKLCAEFATLASIENVAFSYDLSGGDYSIKAEVFHLENAVNNLLDNAKKYAENPVIVLKASKEKGKLLIAIMDNGKGLDERDKNRIFRKYYRVTQGDLYQVKGYGLGLSYVKKVVENHKGKIIMDSKKGKGTTVTISLPLCND